MSKSLLLTATMLLSGLAAGWAAAEDQPSFSPERDLLSLHYDHAPDKDDGHSAVADRCILETEFGCDWIKDHVVAVSGAYGKNAPRFNDKSDAVMDATWHDCGGWIDAHADHDQAVKQLVERWRNCLQNGGDVWVKEGGQSDITADVVRVIRAELRDMDTTKRIHVVQHSDWNENQTTDAALDYTKTHTDYIRIKDANAYLNVQGGDRAFETAALEHPKFGPAWQAAFEYYSPRERLDFSDTGELMHILGHGEFGIVEFKERYLLGGEQ